MKKLSIILLLPALLLLLPSVGSCSENQTFQISETQLTTLEAHLNALEENNAALMTLLNESEMELTEATNQLNESKNQIAELRNQLQALKNESEEARQSLSIANEELKRASESFKASEKAHARIEGRLRTQRNLWEVIAAVMVGVCVTR